MTRQKIFLLLAFIFAVAIAVVVLFIARGKLDRASLVGIYTARPDGKGSLHYLELNADGTYTHRFTGPNNQKIENCGTWEVDLDESVGRSPEVIFNDFVTGVPDIDGVGRGKGSRTVPIVRPLFGPLRLDVSWDYEYSFIKRKSGS